MTSTTKHLAFLASAFCLATALLQAGCAGSSSSTESPSGCGGVLTGPSLTVQYPARSRTSSLTTPLTSALSAAIVLKGGSPTSSDVTVTVNRDPSKLGAHTEQYSLPSLSTGEFPLSVTFYSAANQGGVVVGSISASDSVSCAGQSIAKISLATKAASVAVTPVTLKTGQAAVQLAYVVKDASGTAIPVSAGSVSFSGKGSAASVSSTGSVSPVAVGTESVTATVDGIVSPVAAVTVVAATSPSSSYKIVDLGPGQPVAGKPLNDNGVAIFLSAATPPQLVVEDVATHKLTTLGPNVDNASINNSNLVVGNASASAFSWQGPTYTTTPLKGSAYLVTLNDLGNAVGLGPYSGSNRNAVYWASVAGSQVALKGVGGNANLFVEPEAINSSKIIVGQDFDTQFNACYYPSPTSNALLLPKFGSGRSEASAINSSGAVVGFADNGSDEFAVIWDTVTSTPKSLGSQSSPGSSSAFGINDSGTVVGIDQFAPTNEKAFVYTASAGLKGLYDLCDASRTGWELDTANGINNKGWIFGRGFFSGAEHVYVAIPNP